MKLLLILFFLVIPSFAQSTEPPVVTPKWSLTAGQLPPGITISESGLLTGKATTAGTYTFTIKLVYGTQSVEKQFTLTVAVASSVVLEITAPDIFPATAIGGEYSFQLTFRATPRV